MASDLTERLAAKRWPRTDCFSGDECSECHPLRVDVAENAASLLPLLLSEPELVASLPESVRLSVLTPREQAQLRLGRAHYAHSVLLRERWNDFDALEESDKEILAARRAVDVLALTPEVDNG